MNKQNFPAATKNLIETSRKTVVNAIDASHETTQKALLGCDKVFKASADTLGYTQVVITAKLRDELISLEGQMTLLANIFTRTIATQSVAAANSAATMASSAADKFDRVFDLRVMKALDRMGVPARSLVEELAGRIAAVATKIDSVIQAMQPLPVAPIQESKIKVTKPKSGAAPRNTKRVAKTAH